MSPPVYNELMDHSQALILTLMLDRDSFALLNGLRQRHFPPARNHIPAHLTLFHALPGAEEAALVADLGELAAATPPLALELTRPLLLGKGVAIVVDCPELAALRAELRRRWLPWLTPQDRQGFRPHVTVQNKVAPEAARRLHEELSAGWEGRAGRGEGLLLWRYLGGPWQRLATFPFAGAAAP